MSTSDCEEKHSGFIKWPQLASMAASLLAVVVTITIFEASAMIDVDKSARFRDSAILETMSGIRSSLARIEAKLDITK